MSLFRAVVEHLPATYSRAKSDNERLSFAKPSIFAPRSFWRSFAQRLESLEERVAAVQLDLNACCCGSDAKSLSEVCVYQAYNRVVAASASEGLVQPFPAVPLPPFWRGSAITEHQFSSAIQGRDEFSFPIRVDSGGKVKYGYFSSYGMPGEAPVGEVPEAELVRLIEQSIQKNRSDASAIFKYTQTKRVKRWLSSSQVNRYFALAETEADKYDLPNIDQGLLPCWGSAMLWHHQPAGRDQFGATTSGAVTVGAPLPSSPQERPSLPVPNGVAITCLGHASLLIQFELEGITVLTDPVFHDLNLVLYPRKTRPACSPRDLPPIDVIVISHNHRDHVDEPALRWLAKQQPLILVPEGDGQLMRSWGFLKVQEHSTWAETRIPFQRAPLQSCDEHASSASEEGFSGYVGLVSVPANHWSCRSLNDANLSLFLGWVMYSSVGTGSVYFAGDTALLAEQDVRDITVTAVSKGVYPPIVINLQPGGPNHERATMEGTHTSAADGVFNHFQHILMATKLQRQDGCSFDRFLELCSSYLTVFMHHNVFELGVDRFNEALFVQRHLLNALAVLQGVEESALESPIQEPIPGFVHDVAASLLELLDSCGVEHRLTDATSDHLTHFSALVEERVISPKIGSCTFVPYPYA